MVNALAVLRAELPSYLHATRPDKRTADLAATGAQKLVDQALGSLAKPSADAQARKGHSFLGDRGQDVSGEVGQSAVFPDAVQLDVQRPQLGMAPDAFQERPPEAVERRQRTASRPDRQSR